MYVHNAHTPTTSLSPKKKNHNNKLRCEEKAVKLFSQQTELAEVNVCVLQLRQKMERGV